MRILLISWAITLGLLSESYAQATRHDSIIHQDQFRSFLIHTPPAFTNTHPLPLVIILHRESFDAMKTMEYTGFNSVADSVGFIVVYPEGVNSSWSVDPMESEADLFTINGVDFINRLIDSIEASYTINTDKIFIAGMSQGGDLSQRIGVESGERIAAIASIASSALSVPESFLKGKCPAPSMFFEESDSAAEIWNFFERHSLKICLSKSSLDIPVKNHSSSLSVYPNPVQRSLFINYADGSIERIEVFDHEGKPVMEIAEREMEYPLNVSHLTTGIYMLKVLTGDGETHRHLMVKE